LPTIFFLPPPPATPSRRLRPALIVATLACAAFACGVFALAAAGQSAENADDETPAKKAASAPSPENADGTFDGRIAAAWQALAKRDVAAAKTAIADATGQIANGDQRGEVAQMQILIVSVDQFWREVDAELKRLQPGDELDLNNTKAAVVEAKADSLTLHVDGKNQKYARAALPGRWALALAEHRFDNSAANKRLLGAFLAVDPQGDRRRARQLWEKVQKGEPAAGELLSLMTHTNIPAGPSGKDVIGGDAGRGKAGKGKSGRGEPGGNEPDMLPLPAGPAELPSKDKLTAAGKRLKETYAAELRGAKSPESKLELSQTLIGAAAETDDDAWRLALLRQGLELSAGAGDVEAIDELIATMKRQFKIDGWEVNAEAFTRAAAAAKSATINVVVRRALKLLDQWEDQDPTTKAAHAKVAKKLDQVTVAAAHKAHDPELIKAAVGREKRDN
jgi:hypothetical protein